MIVVGMWRMIILSLLLSLFCATDHLSFFCLMTLAHIVCWCRCNTDTQMTLSDNHTFREGPCTGKKENTFRKFISATTPKNSFSHSLEPLTEDLIVLVHIVFYIHSLVVESVESIYYQSAQHVLASPDFWAIL